MSSIIKFSTSELRKLATSGKACVEERRVTTSLALQPWCLANLKASIKNLLDCKLGKFDKEYGGILLSYKNLNIPQNFGAIHNDHTDIHFQVQADFFIFRPYLGATLTGIVNKKSMTHLGILVHRVFNVVIPRPTEEPGHCWIGTLIQEGQQVTFKILMLDLFGALPYIRGELDERDIKENSINECIKEIQNGSAGILNVSHVHFDKTKPQSRKKSIDVNYEAVSPPPQASPKQKTLCTKHNKLGNDQSKSPALETEKGFSKNKSKRERTPSLEEQESYSPSHEELKSHKSKKRKPKQS